VKFEAFITAIGVTVIGIVCGFDRNLTFAEKASLLYVAVLSVRVLGDEGPVKESMHRRDFLLAVALAAFLSSIGARPGA
jgi:hypothetical protein